MPKTTPARDTGCATGGTRAAIRQPAAWWAAGCLELRWSGRKRIDRAIDGATTGTEVVRIWQVVAGQVRIEHGGRQWSAGPGDWLVLPGVVVRQSIPAGTVMRSLGLTWRDADGRQPLAQLAPWAVPAARHRRLDRAVAAIERWMSRHGAGWPTPDAPRTSNRAPVAAAVYGRLQERLFRLLGLLLAGRLPQTVADAAVVRALAVLRAHAAGAYPGNAMVADAAGLGTRRLEQRFATALGTGPRAWHQQLRLDEARRRLLAPDPVIKSVAAAVGFSSLPAFRRWFVAAQGCAPTAWRRRQLAAEE